MQLHRVPRKHKLIKVVDQEKKFKMKRCRLLLVMVTTLAASMDSIGGQDVNWSCVDQKLDELKVTVLNNYERITRLRMIRVNILVFVLPTIYLA